MDTVIACPHCAAKIEASALYCDTCGRSVSLASEFLKLRRQLVLAQEEADSLGKRLARVSTDLDALEAVAGRKTWITKKTPSREAPGAKAEAAPPLAANASPSAAQEAEQPLQTPVQSEAETKQILNAKRADAPIPSAEPAGEALSELRFGQRWLLIVGLVITLLGIGYFLKFAFDRNWVGPEGRTAMAYLAAISFLFGGSRLKRKWEHFGLTMIGGGVAALYLSTYAAFELYELMPQPVAFGLMTLTTALAGILAVVHDTRWLAILGLVGGFTTPVLLSTGVDRQIVLMSYMLMLNLGLLAITFFKSWRLLLWLCFLFTWALFTGWTIEHYHLSKFWPTQVFLTIFFLVYALAPLAYLFRNKDTNLQGNMTLMTLNTLIALSFSGAMIEEYADKHAVAIPIIAYALLFLVLARFVSRRAKEQTALFALFAVKAMLLLVIAVPLLLDDQWITICWALQAFALVWLALRTKSRRLLFGGLALFALTLGNYLHNYDEVFNLNRHLEFFPNYGAQFVERLLTALAVLGSLYGSLRLLRADDTGTEEDKEKANLRPSLWMAFLALLFFVLHVETAGFFNDTLPKATSAAVSVLWTLFAITLILFGLSRKNKPLRLLAIALFAVTVVKVLFVDMAQFSTPFRIISFMVLGLVLIFVSYLYNRLGSRLAKAETENDDMR